MTRVLRTVAILIMAALGLSSLLPPWEVCWHGDGSVCTGAEPVPCCGDPTGATDRDPDPGPCPDCTDLPSIDTARGSERARATLTACGPVSLAPTRPLVLCHAALETSRTRAQGPPAGPPPSLIDRPIRC